MTRAPRVLACALPACAIALLAACAEDDRGASSHVAFEPRSLGSGVAFTDHHGRPPAAKQHVTETMGGGVGLLDLEGDGDLDLLLLNGDPHDGSPPAPSRLFRNEGSWRFTDVTGVALGELRLDASGVAVGDVDNDGRDDAYIAANGRGRLLLNSAGRLQQAPDNAGIAVDAWQTACALADLDGDGDLDLYIGGYLRFDAEARALSERGGEFRGHRVIAGPRGMPREGEWLLRNRLVEDGALAFEDVTAGSGLGRPAYTLDVVVADLDHDRDLDLYVANDSDPNALYQNDGGLHFTDVAALAGVALSGDGAAQAGMGVDAGDADGDGREDLFVTHFSHDHDTLYLADGPLSWRDATRIAGLFVPSFAKLGFGCAFLDADLDGDLDLAVAQGHVYPNVDALHLNTTYAQHDQLLENLGRGRFVPLPDAFSPAAAPAVSRALARGDLDGDGREDLVITRLNGAPELLHNASRGGRALVLRLRARRGHAGAVGARVEAQAGSRRLMRQVTAAGSYLASSSAEVHLGLGEAASARVIVRWPSGLDQDLGELPADHRVQVFEGEAPELQALVPRMESSRP